MNMKNGAINSNEKIYHHVRSATVSYNCEQAAKDYFEMIAPLCHDKEDIAHSLLRLAIRPVFYLGITDSDGMFSYIEFINKNKHSFLGWLSSNKDIVMLIIKELTICCFFYSLKYDDEKKIVKLDHKVSREMEDVFVEIQDRDIYEEFSTFNSFKEYFYSFFHELGISNIEIDRIILEEGYKDEFFPEDDETI